MDPCQYCECLGNIVECKSAICTHHESWYSRELRKELFDERKEALELVAELSKVLDSVPWCDTPEAYVAGSNAMCKAKAFMGEES